MGLQAQIYASSVASEILAVISKGREAGKDDKLILSEVQMVAEGIKSSADGGWY